MRELESEIAVSRTENIRLKMLFRLKLFYEKWRGTLYSGVLYSGVFVFFWFSTQTQVLQNIT